MTHEQHAKAGRLTRAARSAWNRTQWARECGKRESARAAAKLSEATVTSVATSKPRQAPTPTQAAMCTCSCGHTHADMTL